MQQCCFCNEYVIDNESMKPSVFLIAMFQMFVFLPSFGFSNVFIDLKTSQSFEELTLTEAGKVILYVESDCDSCKKYLDELSKCSEVQRDDIQILSLSSPAQTKKAFRKYLKRFQFLVLSQSTVPKIVFATPTTKYGTEVKVGSMSCLEFVHFIGDEKKSVGLR